MPRNAPPIEIFAERLGAAREQRGYSQRELAERCGLQPSSIAHFERGGRRPSLENLARLSDSLQVSADYLLGRSDQPAIVQSDDPLIREVSRLNDDDKALALEIIRAVAKRLKNKAKARS